MMKLKKMENKESEWERLVRIMDELRVKCPWDREQTIHSLRPQTIEELYELTDAVSEENWKGIKEELGDVLLHVVFYSKIAAEKEKFTIDEVINGLCDKLISRHPHIYGQVKVKNAEDVRKNWETIKLKEGRKSVLSGVPRSMPALPKAYRIQGKVKKVGFDWDRPEDVWNKVEEEMAELKEAVGRNRKEEIKEELGDLLFSIINYARFLEVDAEEALESTNRKFISRFQKMEAFLEKEDKSITEQSLEEMNSLWEKAKSEDR